MAKGVKKVIAPQDALRAILQKRRLDLGLTQDQVAFLAGYDRTTIIKIENGQRTPTLSTILDLCSVLGIHPSTVMKQLGKDIGFQVMPPNRIKEMLEAEKNRRPPKRFGTR